jgi:hypothetical protein
MKMRYPLPEKQAEVLRLTELGELADEIAEKLGLAMETVSMIVDWGQVRRKAITQPSRRERKIKPLSEEYDWLPMPERCTQCGGKFWMLTNREPRLCVVCNIRKQKSRPPI